MLHFLSTLPARIFDQKLPEIPWKYVFIVLLVSAGVRLGVVSTTDLSSLQTDALLYDHAARSLVLSGTMLQQSDPYNHSLPELITDETPKEEPLHHFSTGFPVYLATVYKFAGLGVQGRYVAAVILALLGSVLVPIFAIGIFRRLGGKSPQAMIVLAATVGLWPEAFGMTFHLLSENLTVILLSAWVYLIVTLLFSKKSPSYLRLFMAGCWGGLLFLVRGEFAPVLLFTGIIIALKDAGHYRWTLLFQPHKWNLANSSIFILGLLPFLMAPSIRNYYHFGEVIPITSAGGKGLWMASLNTAIFGYHIYPERRLVAKENYVPGKPGMTDKNYYRTAFRNIRQNPIFYLRGIIHRFYQVNFTAFSEPPVGGKPLRNWIWRGVLRLSKVLLVLAFLWGSWITYRAIPLPVLFIFSIYAFKFMLLHVIFFGSNRYFFPFYPVAVAVAARGIELFWMNSEKIQPRLKQKTF